MAIRAGFLGFLSGDTVRMSVGGATVETGPEGWRPTANTEGVSATIVARRSHLQIAPEGINFEVLLDGFDNPGPVGGDDSYDPQFHNIYYFWSFGDAGAIFTAPEKILPEHLDADRGYGPLASHTYAEPGAYTVSVLVVEPASGKTATAELVINVGDAESLFANDRTYYVDPDGVYADAPANARTFQTIDQAFSAQGALSGVNYIRIMLRRDAEHTMISRQFRNNFKNLWVCSAPGSGLPSRINATLTDVGGIIQDRLTKDEPTKKTDVVFSDLRLQGLTNTRTEDSGGGDFYRCFAEYANYTLFHDVEANGFTQLYWLPARHYSFGPDDINLIFNNTSMSNWGNFAAYLEEQGFTSLTGVRMTQDPDALSGGPKGFGHNEHGPIRIQWAGKCLIQSCDFFSRTGWFENIIGFHTTQPCVRWNQAGNPRAKLNMQGCVAEGGSEVVQLKVHNPATANRVANNMLIDKCYLIGDTFTKYLIQCEHSGLTLRNSVLIHPNSTKLLSLSGFVQFVQQTSDPIVAAAPQRLYSNTFLNQMSPDKAAGGAVTGADYANTAGPGATDAFLDIRSENNLRHEPNLIPPNIVYAPLDTTVLHPVRYQGYKDRTHFSTQTTFGTAVADGASFDLPYSSFAPGLTAADFIIDAGNARSTPVIVVNGGYRSAGFALNANTVTVTNLSGGTWNSADSFTVGLYRTIGILRPGYETPPDTFIKGQPLPGSPALGAAISGLRALDDMQGKMRPSYASLGAYEAPS